MSTTTGKDLRPSRGSLELAIALMIDRYGDTRFEIGVLAGTPGEQLDRLYRKARRRHDALIRLTYALRSRAWSEGASM